MDLIRASSDMLVLSVVEDPPSNTVSFLSVSKSNQEVYVVFKGSSSLDNFETDALILLTSFPCPTKNCSVHMGFFKAYMSVKSRILTELDTIMNNKEYAGYRLVLTGHSLGAALATLLAADVSVAGQTPVLMNFGSPRVGEPAWAAFASSVITTRYRVTHYKDEVPHMPSPLTFGYQHISGEWYQNVNTTLPTPCVGYEDPKCADQWSAFQVGVEDHMMYLNQHMYCPWPEYMSNKEEHSFFPFMDEKKMKMMST